MKLALASAVAVIALSAASPASAALVLVPGGACSPATPNPDALACAGAFAGNLNSNSSIADLNLALDALVGGNFAPDVLFAALDPTKALFSAGSGTNINFANALFGEQIFSIHFGDAGTGLGDRTILYSFNFGTQGATTVTLGTAGFSNAVLITPSNTAVPEPATWAMMLVGFGAVGYSLRRRSGYRVAQAV